MEECDADSKGFISKDSFLNFYRKSVKDRPYTVLSNLKACGVKGFYQFDCNEKV